MDQDSKSSLNQLWDAEVRQVAARNPRLAQELWQNRQVYYARFATFYGQLASLPRKYRRKLLRRLATTLAGAALLLALGQALPAHAATITVDGVTCTLADAIQAANLRGGGTVGGCTGGEGADTLDLQTDVLLSAALPGIETEIVLEGNGHTLDGNNTFRILSVQATGNLTVNNTIITHGLGFDYFGDGGGIRSDGILSVNDSIISDNSAVSAGGGISNGGILFVSNSTISGNTASQIGGGIVNSGISITVTNSVISGNSANFGGGIDNNFMAGTVEVNSSLIIGNSAYGGGGGMASHGGPVIVNNSTFSGNSTDGDGGGIRNGGVLTIDNSTLTGNHSGGSSGGLANFGGTVTLTNSTISGNSASSFGGGIVNTAGTFTVNNSTLSGNSANVGGGIHNGYQNSGGTVNLNRSLISGNSATNGAEVYNHSSGVVNANNSNVVGHDGDARSVGFTPGPNDIIPPGPLASVLDTILADNGGSTLTHALVSGSVAIDAAPDAPCLAPPINGVDQRGFPRNVDGNGTPSSNECDSGSFEYALSGAPTPTPTVSSTFTATATGSPSPTATSTPTFTNTPGATLTSTTPSRSSPTPSKTPPITRTPTQRPTRTPTPTQTPVALALN